MSHVGLKDALRLVETLGLTPLSRLYASRPKNYFDQANSYDRWRKRLHDVEAEVIDKLTAQGASFTKADATRIRFAGVTASSAISLQSALNHWKAGAERRLSRTGGRP